jgi:hypothetical protein
MNYISFLPPINLYGHQNDDIALPSRLPPNAHPLNTILRCLSSRAAILVNNVFCFILFFIAQLAGQMDGTNVQPHAPCPVCLLFNIPPTVSAYYRLIVGCLDPSAATSRLRPWCI